MNLRSSSDILRTSLLVLTTLLLLSDFSSSEEVQKQEQSQTQDEVSATDSDSSKVVAVEEPVMEEDEKVIKEKRARGRKSKLRRKTPEELDKEFPAWRRVYKDADEANDHRNQVIEEGDTSAQYFRLNGHIYQAQGKRQGNVIVIEYRNVTPKNKRNKATTKAPPADDSIAAQEQSSQSEEQSQSLESPPASKTEEETEVVAGSEQEPEAVSEETQVAKADLDLKIMPKEVEEGTDELKKLDISAQVEAKLGSITESEQSQQTDSGSTMQQMSSGTGMQQQMQQSMTQTTSTGSSDASEKVLDLNIEASALDKKLTADASLDSDGLDASLAISKDEMRKSKKAFEVEEKKSQKKSSQKEVEKEEVDDTEIHLADGTIHSDGSDHEDKQSQSQQQSQSGGKIQLQINESADDELEDDDDDDDEDNDDAVISYEDEEDDDEEQRDEDAAAAVKEYLRREGHDYDDTPGRLRHVSRRRDSPLARAVASSAQVPKISTKELAKLIQYTYTYDYQPEYEEYMIEYHDDEYDDLPAVLCDTPEKRRRYHCVEVVEAEPEEPSQSQSQIQRQDQAGSEIELEISHQVQPQIETKVDLGTSTQQQQQQQMSMGSGMEMSMGSDMKMSMGSGMQQQSDLGSGVQQQQQMQQMSMKPIKLSGESKLGLSKTGNPPSEESLDIEAKVKAEMQTISQEQSLNRRKRGIFGIFGGGDEEKKKPAPSVNYATVRVNPREQFKANHEEAMEALKAGNMDHHLVKQLSWDGLKDSKDPYKKWLVEVPHSGIKHERTGPNSYLKHKPSTEHVKFLRKFGRKRTKPILSPLKKHHKKEHQRRSRTKARTDGGPQYQLEIPSTAQTNDMVVIRLKKSDLDKYKKRQENIE